MSKVSSTLSSAASSSDNSSNENDYESAIYDYAISTLSEILPNVNTIDGQTQNSIKSEIDAYETSGIEDINKYYNSGLTDLQNDSASRFGNLDNSMFIDSLSDLESERANAVGSFSQDVLSRQSELESEAIEQNYSYVDLLYDIINSYYDNSSVLANIYSQLNSDSSSSSSSSRSNSSNLDSLLSKVSSIVSNFM